MSTKRAVYTFIGNSVWKDDNGQLWCAKKHDNPDVKATRTLEVEGRDDLEFMVRYGEMKKVDIEEVDVDDTIKDNEDGKKDEDHKKDEDIKKDKDGKKDEDHKKNVKIDIRK